MSPRRLLSSGELAQKFGLSRRTITRYVEIGWLSPEFTTPGGQYRFDAAESANQMNEIRQRLREEREHAEEARKPHGPPPSVTG